MTRNARRYVRPTDAAVWVASGRWGPRRVRVTECWAILRAEITYDELLQQNHYVRPGGRGEMRCAFSANAQEWRVEFEVRSNAVWRQGRLFYLCPRCAKRATRLYMPTEALQPRCRTCWGLSYESRTWSYRAGGSLSEICYITSAVRREERRAASRERYAARRTR